MTALDINGCLSIDAYAIRVHVLDFYSSLLSGFVEVPLDSNLFSKYVLQLVEVSNNDVLSSVPSFEGTKRSIFGMDPINAPGSYGFAGSFFQKCWNIIYNEFIYAVQYFFVTSFLQPGLNLNFMILLPKFENAVTLYKFRSIMLGNFFLFEIISKILVDMLALIASKILLYK